MTGPAVTIVIAADSADFARWCAEHDRDPRDASIRYAAGAIALRGLAGPAAVEYTDRGYYRADRDDIVAAVAVINAARPRE